MTVPENPIGGWNAWTFQRIRYVNGHVDILYSYNVCFAVQYISNLMWTHYRIRGTLKGATAQDA